MDTKKEQTTSDGSTASYYELPPNSSELQDLISDKNMNAQIGEIFRECYRYGEAAHCDTMRGINKILFYAVAEKKRLLMEAKGSDVDLTPDCGSWEEMTRYFA